MPSGSCSTVRRRNARGIGSAKVNGPSTAVTLCFVMPTSEAIPPDGTVLGPLLSINSVAAYLGISRAMVYNLISKGDLVPIRVGERVRFDPADVRDYLERNREPNTMNEESRPTGQHSSR
jgi:excisionase family DNA binding protein